MTRSEKKRKHILEAAIAEFLEFGFRGTSMDRIAERANVSKRTVYNHYQNKEGLFRAMVEKLLSHASVDCQISFDANQSVRDQLMTIARKQVAFVETEEAVRLTRLILSEFVRSPAFARQMIGEIETPADRMVEWCRAARKAGRLKCDDLDEAARQFVSLFKGRLFWPRILMDEPMPDRNRKEAIIGSLVDLFLARYGVLNDTNTD